MLKIDWSARSKYANHSKLNSEHNWRNLYDHLMSTIIFHIDNDKGINHTSFENRVTIDYEHILDLLFILL